MKKTFLLVVVMAAVLALVLSACGQSTPAPTQAPAQVATTAPAKPTATPMPSATPMPTDTPAPSATPMPTDTPAPGDPAAGEALFNSDTIGDNPGCHTCHSLEPDKVIVGPSLAGMADDAAGDAAETGISTEEMLKEMITDPNAELAGDFPADVMPQNFGSTLTPQQLNDVIAFLMTLK